MNEFIKRNMPVFIIGLVTIGVFITIIITASKNPAKSPYLQEVKDEQLITEKTATIGPKDAKVILVEFSDFECPACKEFHPVMSSLIEKYKDRVLFAYKHFPLPQHKSARSAAQAAEAAAEQGKFWQYADKLFDNQPDFSRDNYIKWASEVNIDTGKFMTDLDSEEIAKRVAADYDQAQRIGLSSTPSFILNNKVLKLTAFSDLEKAIIEELEKNNIETPEVEQTTQSTQSTYDPVTNVPRTNMDSTYGTIDIDYRDQGFFPTNAKALVGQLVRITNRTGLEIKFEQIIVHFTNIDNPLAIGPGQTAEFRLEKEGLWTFKENKKRHYGSVFTVAQE